ncbi:alkaline phosphatase family protein [bacterium]|nr:alkaline phosphatase family protein [bacterium]MCI0607000.1 alkaline phosphatase family protein [bacterium]
MTSKVIVIGLDGFEPKIVDSLISDKRLPNLAKLFYSRIQTTNPALTPVAWSTFATGVNPAEHGIFDFVRRDPRTYLPDLSLTRYEQKSSFLPPKVVNLRGGIPFWHFLSKEGIPSVILRCPCTYPPDNLEGRMLSGMGVPDLRGGLGTTSFYRSAETTAQENEHVIRVVPTANSIHTNVIGPRNPKDGTDFHCPIVIELDRSSKKIVIRQQGQQSAIELREKEWSNWLKLKFKTGALTSVRGMVRFYFVQMEPVFELFASPVNFDPDAPLFPISSPFSYASDLSAKVGAFYTTGMVEEHGGLNNGRLSEDAYLKQCEAVLRERERMMQYELQRFQKGFFFCLFDTPDRLQHMFWRPEEGARKIIEDHYVSCDQVIGRAMESIDDNTLFIVLSDHGMNSFQRGFHVNTWLLQQGLLTLQNGKRPEDAADGFFRNVDWEKTRAYAVGLSGLYLNLKGRESKGIVEETEAESLKRAMITQLLQFVDPEKQAKPVRRVLKKEEAYSGSFLGMAPDLLINFQEGYRASWATALGGMSGSVLEDNSKRWSGDHIIDPELVPGVLFMNRPFSANSDIKDLAPTILQALGLAKPPSMEGESLLA